MPTEKDEIMMKETERVKFFISTKTELLTDKVNDWIDAMTEQNPYMLILNIEPYMSYTSFAGKGKDSAAYMIGCMVRYIIGEVIDDGDDGIEDSGIDPDNFGLTFPS